MAERPDLGKCTHVIFDLGGTLLNSEPVIQKALETALSDYLTKIQIKELQKVRLGRSTSDAAKLIMDKHDLPLTLKDFVKHFEAEQAKYISGCALMPGAEFVVRHLKKFMIPMAVCTSTTSSLFPLISKKHTEFFKLFHHVVLGDDPAVLNGKPAPDSYIVCGKKFVEKPHPSECLVFEDSLVGMEAATAARMKVVLVPNKILAGHETTKPDLLLNCIDDIDFRMFHLPPLAKYE